MKKFALASLEKRKGKKKYNNSSMQKEIQLSGKVHFSERNRRNGFLLPWDGFKEHTHFTRRKC